MNPSQTWRKKSQQVSGTKTTRSIGTAKEVKPLVSLHVNTRVYHSGKSEPKPQASLDLGPVDGASSSNIASRYSIPVGQLAASQLINFIKSNSYPDFASQQFSESLKHSASVLESIQFQGPSCTNVPDVDHSENLQHCQNTKHGEACKVPCIPGYTQSSELICIDGKWKTDVKCSLRYFLTEVAPFLSTWTECSQHSPPAHLAVIKSQEENTDIQRVCSTSPTSRCFIGIVTSTDSSETDHHVNEVQWLDGSALGFARWRSSAGIVDSGKNCYIDGQTGLWGQTPQQAKLPAVCQVGDCIPSAQESFLAQDIPTNIRIRACLDSLPTPRVVTATNGCDLWEIPLQTEFISSPNNPNNSTLYNTWMGKKTFLSQRIDIVDEPPHFTSYVADASISCEEYVDTPPDIQAIDDCDGTIVVEYSQTRSSKTCPFVVYHEWRAEDTYKQMAYLQQVIRVGF